jgi:hypothetical protein
MKNQPIYDEFIDANLPTIDWEYISSSRILTQRQLIKYRRYIVWPIAVKTQVLSPGVCRIVSKYL